ncbi:MAG TPA: 1,4-alpha-glucan branching protein GlgB [bacterium]|nr:1,4-alpha-glucan branching protein GlgB [bacterium]
MPSPKKKPEPVATTLSAKDLDLFLSLKHGDPHSILGIHPQGDGIVVRVFRPDALTVSILPRESRPSHPVDPSELSRSGQWIEAGKAHPSGLFEAYFPGAKELEPYQVRVEYAGRKVFTYWDPYAFWPTLGDMDLHLLGEGNHEKLHEKMGAHLIEWQGIQGFSFAVWAPSAQGVSVVGDFNGWDGRLHPMRRMGVSGLWEIFIPELTPGKNYKYEIHTGSGRLLKADPFAFATEKPPLTASVVFKSQYVFKDQEWMENRAKGEALKEPVSIYEMHLESWRKVPEEGNRPLTYREMAKELAEYVLEMGFTHVEFMPVMEHPFGGSWGYQVSAYFAPTARFGSPDDFKYLVDYLHQQGIGVILDWVPAHFPKDEFALGRFDGTALYEHLDPRQGEHPDWGTYVFNFGRNEVRNFLLSNALFWLSEYHVDGLRIDAVASMLYLDYSRNEGEWVPNQFGGNENLEAIHFLKRLNEVVYGLHPGVLMIAEESTAWAGVSRPTYTGGLGFGFKWNMGWMHDTLHYFSRDPVYRRYHHNNLTFGFLYAWSENFILPLSHDEVVHGKCSLIDKMPGDRWQKFANLRALFAYMWAHPGKKLLFMGGEFGQFAEWNHDQSLDWHLTQWADHWRLQNLVRDLNHHLIDHPALHEADNDPSGFQWVDANNVDDNIAAFLRKSPATGRQILCVGNFSPVIRGRYRVGVPKAGYYREMLNTDSHLYGGGNFGNHGGVEAQAVQAHGMPYSAEVSLPPLSVVWFEVP